MDILGANRRLSDENADQFVAAIEMTGTSKAFKVDDHVSWASEADYIDRV
jgi:hypothetical protein